MIKDEIWKGWEYRLRNCDVEPPKDGESVFSIIEYFISTIERIKRERIN